MKLGGLLLPVLGCAWLACAAGCEGSECTERAECGGSYLCVEGRCQLKPSAPNPAYADASFSRPDTGVPPRDGGVADAHPEGTVWLAETAMPDGTTEVRAHAELREYTGPISRRAPAGANCIIEDRRISVVTGRQISATSITLTESFNPLARSVVLLPTVPGELDSGRIELTDLFVPTSTDGPLGFDLTVQAGANPGDLDTFGGPFRVTLRPGLQLDSPSPGTIVSIQSLPEPQWRIPSTVLDMVIAQEISQVDRQYRLYCVGDRSPSSHRIPETLRDAFVAGNPRGPLIYEIRATSGEFLLTRLPVVGGGTMQVMLIASYGFRFSAR